MATQPSIEERLSRLEGVYEHLATKVDIERIEGRLAAFEARIEGRIAAGEARLLRWLIPTVIASIGAAAAVASAVS